jgi:F0F1-type ATP synthase assembly protein I
MPFNDPIPDPKPQSKLGAGVNNLVQAEKLLQIALVLPSATLIGWGAGAWADGRFHQSWISITGIIFGSISGMVYVIRQAFDAEKRSGSEAEAGNGSGKGTSNLK